jgi:hypothetical protein
MGILGAPSWPATYLLDSSASDLKVVLAGAAAHGIPPRFVLDLFKFFTHRSEPFAEFSGVNLYRDPAMITADARLRTRFEVAHQN